MSISPKSIRKIIKKVGKPTFGDMSDKDALRYLVWKNRNGTCYLCKQPVSLQEMTIDHRISKYRGGDDSLKNLWPTHKECNYLKGSLEVPKGKVRSQRYFLNRLKIKNNQHSE